MSSTTSRTLLAIASLDTRAGKQTLRLRSSNASAAMIWIRQNAASLLQRATNCSVVTGVEAGAAKAVAANTPATIDPTTTLRMAIILTRGPVGPDSSDTAW